MSVTYSQNFLAHVRLLYSLALDDLVSGRVARSGINCYTHFAGPAYVSAVAAIEAFANEVVYAVANRDLLEQSVLWTLDHEWIEKLDIVRKLVIVPQLLSGRTFQSNAQPHQDLQLLVKIRNAFVHYKMDDRVPKYVKALAERNIALNAPPGQADFLWIHKLSTSEGIRWANNTVCLVARAFFEFMPAGYTSMMPGLIENFVDISDESARERLQQSGLT